MSFKCNPCNRDFNSEESLKQHNLAKHTNNEKKEKINSRKYFVFGIVGLIIILSSFTVYSYMNKPGGYDDFANCLSDIGVVVYGNDFCRFTNEQLNFFGKSKENLNYIKCFDNKKLCNEKGIEITPTWEINGKMYEQVQDFEKLSQISGCKL
ncbi:hypothetical protein CMI39_00225 [Candidatus Pacearchaeota archaeon]|jgi:hypothetical protein|nr:hypothetical protein [Candidatus Pacearchaeota archaeon]|tara:strand:+ start:4991 stop:5446 length:456 start_codon:yes stop_codon:yes gene_type:complete